MKRSDDRARMEESGQLNWFTMAEAAARWRLSYDTVRRQVLNGEIPVMKWGRARRISREYVEKVERAAMTSAVHKVTHTPAKLPTCGKDHYADCG